MSSVQQINFASVSSATGGSFPGGLSVWARYKASSMSSVGDGNTLSQWDDITGNARHATQATAARRPFYRAAASGLFGNTAAIETKQQRIRYRLSRNIDWNPTFVGALPLQPRDGTGPFYYD